LQITDAKPSFIDTDIIIPDFQPVTPKIYLFEKLIFS